MRSPSWCCRRVAASSREGRSPTSRCSTKRCGSRRQNQPPASSCSGPNARPWAEDGAGPRLGVNARRRDPRGARRRLRAGCRHGSALYPLHLRNDRKSPKAWRCATTKVKQGGAEMVDAESLRHRAGRGLVVGLRYRLGRRSQLHRSMRRCCTAAPAFSTKASRSARPDAGAYWQRVRRAWCCRAVHGADRVSRHQERGSARKADRALRPRQIPHAVSRRRARRSRHGAMGREHAARAGDRLRTSRQTETGWCIAGNLVGLGMLLVKLRLADPRRCQGYDLHIVDESAAAAGRQAMGSIVIKPLLPPGCLAHPVAAGRALP